jgi:integrase
MRGEGLVYLRGKTFWIRYWHKGTEIRESAKTDDERTARRILKSRLDDLAAERKGFRKFATPAMKKVTVHDLLESLKADFMQRGKTSSQNGSTIKLADEAFGHIRAMELSPDHVNHFIADKLADGYANASINRITGVIGQAFQLAVREQRISHAPYIKHLPEDNARQGFVAADAFEHVRENLPADLRDFAQFAFSTGWRRGEISSLDWSNLQDNDTMIRLRPDQAKNKNGRSVPVTGKLVDIIKRRREARTFEANGVTKMSGLLFHRGDGQEIIEFRKSWATACKKAGRPGLLFHDLRRSAVTAMVNGKVPQLVAMQISGHKTASMFKRYAIQVEDEMRDAMAATERYHEAQIEKAQAQQHENVRTISK